MTIRRVALKKSADAERPIQRREAKQDRSIIRQRRITEGAIAAISKHGIAGLTHRSVAQEAHVSLAATTYYYQTKTDIIADASRALLTRYLDAIGSKREEQIVLGRGPANSANAPLPASLFLYDLSPTPKAAAVSAENFALLGTTGRDSRSPCE